MPNGVKPRFEALPLHGFLLGFLVINFEFLCVPFCGRFLCEGKIFSVPPHILPIEMSFATRALSLYFSVVPPIPLVAFAVGGFLLSFPKWKPAPFFKTQSFLLLRLQGRSREKARTLPFPFLPRRYDLFPFIRYAPWKQFYSFFLVLLFLNEAADGFHSKVSFAMSFSTSLRPLMASQRTVPLRET